MDAQQYDQGRKRPVWFSPFLLAVVLSPALFQPSTCTPLPPGDTTLSELAVIVGGVEQIQFDASQRSYDVWLPLSADTTLVRAIPTDLSAQVSVALRTGFDLFDAMPWVSGGGEVTIPLEPGTHTLLVKVYPPPGALGGGVVGQYTVGIQVGCSQCDDGNECTDDTCEPVMEMCVHPPVADGAVCDAGGGNVGACDGAGVCVFVPSIDHPLQALDITVGCSRNVTGDVSILSFNLNVDPGPMSSNQPFTAVLDGEATFAESILDAAQAVVPGGVALAQLFDVAATVAVRSGATGPDVVLGADFSVLAEQCSLTGAACTGSPGQGTCLVIPSVTNVCTGGFATIPVINGTPNSAGGCTQAPVGAPVPDCDCTACAALDAIGCRAGDPDLPCTKGDQCGLNGFCVNGDLPLALAAQTGNYTAGPSGSNILFGWFDGETPPVAPGLLTLPPAVFADPTPPVGLRVSVGGLFVAVQCLMAVDSGGPNGIATCLTGPNVGLPCVAPANNACNDGTDAGQQCDQSSATACTFGVPATIGCVNSDCGDDGVAPHICSPPDLASTTPDASLNSFLVP